MPPCRHVHMSPNVMRIWVARLITISQNPPRSLRSDKTPLNINVRGHSRRSGRTPLTTEDISCHTHVGLAFQPRVQRYQARLLLAADRLCEGGAGTCTTSQGGKGCVRVPVSTDNHQGTTTVFCLQQQARVCTRHWAIQSAWLASLHLIITLFACALLS